MLFCHWPQKLSARLALQSNKLMTPCILDSRLRAARHRATGVVLLLGPKRNVQGTFIVVAAQTLFDLAARSTGKQ